MWTVDLAVLFRKFRGRMVGRGWDTRRRMTSYKEAAYLGFTDNSVLVFLKAKSICLLKMLPIRRHLVCKEGWHTHKTSNTHTDTYTQTRRHSLCLGVTLRTFKKVWRQTERRARVKMFSGRKWRKHSLRVVPQLRSPVVWPSITFHVLSLSWNRYLPNIFNVKIRSSLALPGNRRMYITEDFPWILLPYDLKFLSHTKKHPL